jgi:hypothetical protein
MRLVIAMMKHETNSFSPVRTDWQRFRDWGAYLGAEAQRAYEGTAMPIGAYLKLAREIGAEVVTPVAAEAMPSGPAAATRRFSTCTARWWRRRRRTAKAPCWSGSARWRPTFPSPSPATSTPI